MSRSPDSSALRGGGRPWTVLLAALHVALAAWALRAWIGGPFAGDGILDGAEMLALARSGEPGPFATKSPLYPWLLGHLFAIAGDSPWTVGALGSACSLAVLFAIRALCIEFELERAAPFAMLAYVLSGSVYAFAVQPLEPLLASAALAWGVVALARARGTRATTLALLGGAALGASVFTRAPLLLAALAVLGAQLALRRVRAAALAAGGALAVALVCFAAFGSRAWPSASMFNLRMGNGAARSGISDVRPGPAYDRMRLEPAFAAADDPARTDAPQFEPWHRARLADELAADPLGALATLARKAFLFAHRTETVTDSDFRHGLRDWPLAPLLLQSFAVLAPLALASLFARRRPRLALWAPMLGVFAANVLVLTSARYRFPMLPFACVAAGAALIELRARRVWIATALFALLLVPNWSGRELLVPGDGLVQEGRRLLAVERDAARTLEVLERAAAAGRDPRARYELALAYEARERFDEALSSYADALALDPLYPEAAENTQALLLRLGRDDAARAFTAQWIERSPYAGKLWLNRAGLERAAGAPERARALEGRGFALLALRALAQNDLAAARRWKADALARGAVDDRLDIIAR